MKRVRSDGGSELPPFRMADVVERADMILDPSIPPVFPRGEEVPSLWNTTGVGWGGTTEWPFHFWRAVRVQQYRQGVRRSLGDERRSWKWRMVAGDWMKVVDLVIAHEKRVREAKVGLERAEAELAALVANLEPSWVAGVGIIDGILPMVKSAGLQAYE